MALRIKFQGMQIVRRPPEIARYYMQSHRKEIPSAESFQFFNKRKKSRDFTV
jgi:hypothetical protein